MTMTETEEEVSAVVLDETTPMTITETEEEVSTVVLDETTQRGLPAVAAELRRAVRTIFHFQIQLLKRGVVDVPSISPAEPVSEPRLFQVAESERSRSSGPGSS
ncbi:hypothetical protein MRX96_054625 [Rhipicephalus microplus]